MNVTVAEWAVITQAKKNTIPVKTTACFFIRKPLSKGPLLLYSHYGAGSITKSKKDIIALNR